MSCRNDRLNVYYIKTECPWTYQYPGVSGYATLIKGCLYFWVYVLCLCDVYFKCFLAPVSAVCLLIQVFPFHLYNTMLIIMHLKLCCGIVYQSTWLAATTVLCSELNRYQPRSGGAEDYNS